MTEIVTATPDFKYAFIDAFAVPWIGTVAYPNENHIHWLRLARAKLVVFTGGEDINPIIYGHKITHSYFVNPARDLAELKVLKYALQTKKCILGVCRGHQLINAYLGGQLAQDIVMDGKGEHPSNHSLESVNGGSWIVDTFTYVNSIHHQGVTKVGKTLKGTSKYNGVYETTEGPNIISVQFHPEFMGTIESNMFFNFVKNWANIVEEV